MAISTTSAKMPPVWTYLPEGSPASQSVSPEGNLGRMIPDGFGPNSGDSFAFYDPASHCWKTSQASFDTDSGASSVIWPRAGMTRNGTAYRLPPLAPLTAATAFSSSLHAAGAWPTPTARLGDNRGAQAKRYLNPARSNDLDDAVAFYRLWPTPQAGDNRDRGNLSTPAIRRRAAKGKQLNLSMVVSRESGQLNPQWVEWLMGFPAGWTDLED